MNSGEINGLCALIGFVLWFILVIGGGLYSYFTDKKEWNHWICRDNGLPWKRFDVDSQGGRGYKAGNRRCWISNYGVDK